MTADARTVAVFTGSRAEYGLLNPVLRALREDPRLEYRLLVGGSHFDAAYGSTVEEIRKDGFRIDGTVDLPAAPDDLLASTEAIGRTILGLGPILVRIAPRFLLVYGDRFESLGAAVAGTQLGLPTAHIEGGDYTEGGALDDSIRHAMTKLCHLHFTTNAQATERVLKLGEEPWRVHEVGLPALDLIRQGQFAPPEEVAADLGLDPGRPVVLFCQHAVATEADQAEAQVRPSLLALERLAQEGWQVVATYPNQDAGGRAIIRCLEGLRGRPGIQVIPSLGRHRFHGLLNLIGRGGRGCMAGNSSAGIKEALAFGCPVINVGQRQQGRLRGANVLDLPLDSGAIFQAARRCAEDEAFRRLCREAPNPYGAGEAGPRIARVLATVPLGPELVKKRMTF